MRCLVCTLVFGLCWAVTKDLCYYARKDDTGSIKRLIDEGEDPNEPNDNGHLPLEVACDSHAFDAVEVLLEYGANPDVYCSQGTISWFELAIIRGLHDLTNLLHSYSADPDLPDTKMKQSPIQRAISGGNDKLALQMLQYGADPFQTDNEGRSLLLLTAMSGTRRIAIRLLGRGLTPDLECMDVARIYRNDELAEIFLCFLAHMTLEAASLERASAFSATNFNSDCRMTIQQIFGELTRRRMP